VFGNAAGLPDANANTPMNYAEFIGQQQTQSRVTMKYISVSNTRSFLLVLDTRVAELKKLVDQRLTGLGD
jgi:hypothetical protein